MCLSKPKPSAEQQRLISQQSQQIEKQNEIMAEQERTAEAVATATRKRAEQDRAKRLSAEAKKRSRSNLSSSGFFTGSSAANTAASAVTGSLLRRQ